MSGRVAVIGAGALPVGKYGDRPEHEPLIEALIMALKDAGLSKDDVGGLVFSHPSPYAK